MACTRTLPLSRDASAEATRVLLICHELQRVTSYYGALEQEGFEVLVAFDGTAALSIVERSVKPVRVAVVLADPSGAAARREDEFIRSLSNAAPNVPCVIVPAGTEASECAVLIRTAVRCGAVAYLSADRKRHRLEI